MLAPYSKTDTDAQDLTISGNVISLSGQSGNVDLTSTLAPYLKSETDSQVLSISGNVISLTGQSGNVDLTSLLAGGGGGASTLDGLTDVSTSGASSGQVLKYNGSSWAPAADNNSGGGGGGGATIQRFKLNLDGTDNPASTSNLTSLIDSVSINSDILTVTFDSSINYPPASIMMYGYDYGNNIYNITPLETSISKREIAGGGVSGSPTLFGGSSSIAVQIRVTGSIAGATKTFGTTTHVWLEFVVYD